MELYCYRMIIYRLWRHYFKLWESVQFQWLSIHTTYNSTQSHGLHYPNKYYTQLITSNTKLQTRQNPLHLAHISNIRKMQCRTIRNCILWIWLHMMRSFRPSHPTWISFHPQTPLYFFTEILDFRIPGSKPLGFENCVLPLPMCICAEHNTEIALGLKAKLKLLSGSRQNWNCSRSKGKIEITLC